MIPNWNGRAWLGGCLDAIACQTVAPAEVIVVDNGSQDGSLEYLHSEHPTVRVIELGRNTGFAHAANCGLREARGELVALVNTDVVLAGDWLERASGVIAADRGAAAVACKILSLADPGTIYDAGDILRRDGACEQRGRFMPDSGRWDAPGEVFGACAAAALYRRSAVLGVGGFDERYFAYLEDVDLSLRLALAGWRCRYEPTVALHAGEASSRRIRGGHQFLVTRNTVLLVAKAFPLRWLPLVSYRQLAWGWHAAVQGRLGAHVRALAAALPQLPSVLGERRALRRRSGVPVAVAIPRRPIRGPRAGGDRNRLATTRPTPWRAATGERVSTAEGGFNPSFQRHRAEYRLAASLIGDGRTLDLGCGTGHSFRELAPRETVGVDVAPAGLAGQPRETHVADMRRLPFARGSFQSVVAIQSIEHVPDPYSVLAEIARVLVPGGRAVLVTPNRLTFGRPDEIIDPYHYIEYDHAELRRLCEPFFRSVEVLGLRASERYLAIHDRERRELERLLALDPLRLRRLVPRVVKQRLYDRRLSADRRGERPEALEIVPEDFRLSAEALESAIDLFAVCEGPRGHGA